MWRDHLYQEHKEKRQDQSYGYALSLHKTHYFKIVNNSFTGNKIPHEKVQWTLEGELTHDASWAGLTEGAFLRAPPHPSLLAPLHSSCVPPPPPAQAVGDLQGSKVKGREERWAFLLSFSQAWKEKCLCMCAEKRKSSKCNFLHILKPRGKCLTAYSFCVF